MQNAALSVSLAGWVPLRRPLVNRKGFSAGGGSLLRRVQFPHPSGESFDLRKLRPNDSPPVVSAARPPRTRQVPLRFAGSSNLLSVLLRRPGEQITEARLSLRSNPFGGFSFSGRFAPASQRVAAFRPPLRLNLICPAQAPAKSDSASALGLSCQAWIVARFSRVAMLPSVGGRGIPLNKALDKLRGGCSLYWMENSSPR